MELEDAMPYKPAREMTDDELHAILWRQYRELGITDQEVADARARREAEGSRPHLCAPSVVRKVQARAFARRAIIEVRCAGVVVSLCTLARMSSPSDYRFNAFSVSRMVRTASLSS
jgi:hypothetical protein